jgi:glutathione peroxidase
MPTRKIIAAMAICLFTASTAMAESDNACPSTLDHTFQTLDGESSVRLCDTHANQVLLVVNTASKCGYTYQYEGLEKLYGTYRERGLVVVGFPSNDFGGQEPGTEKQIKEFCRSTYGVQFPMYEKTHAAEGKAHPLFQALAKEAGEYPRWNFHKYLINREGRVIGSWRSRTEPGSQEIVQAIEAAL